MIPDAFKSKNFLYYFILQIISYTGSWFQGTAICWMVYRFTNSPLLLGAVGFVSLFPSLFFSPLSGVLSDRFKRKNILAFTQVLFLFQALTLLALCKWQLVNEWSLLLVAFIFGIVNAFDEPAREAFVPLLVEKKHLVSAVSSNSIICNAANVFGPAIGGFLIAKYGEESCFLLNFFMHVPLVIFLFIVKPREQEIKDYVSTREHLKEGLSFVFKSNPAKILLVLVGIFGLWGMSFSILMPVFCEKVFHKNADGMGMLWSFSGIGAVMSGFFLSANKDVLKLKKIIAISGIVFSIVLFLFGLINDFNVALVLLIIMGFTFMILNVGSNTLLQVLTPDYLRGRVVGLYSTMLMGMPPVGNLIMGALANNFNYSVAVIVGAVICFITAIYFLIHVPALTEDLKDQILKKVE